jgi:hypothetical protein
MHFLEGEKAVQTLKLAAVYSRLAWLGLERGSEEEGRGQRPETKGPSETYMAMPRTQAGAALETAGDGETGRQTDT